MAGHQPPLRTHQRCRFSGIQLAWAADPVSPSPAGDPDVQLEAEDLRLSHRGGCCFYSFISGARCLVISLTAAQQEWSTRQVGATGRRAGDSPGLCPEGAQVRAGPGRGVGARVGAGGNSRHPHAAIGLFKGLPRKGGLCWQAGDKKTSFRGCPM